LCVIVNKDLSETNTYWIQERSIQVDRIIVVLEETLNFYHILIKDV
jgi:hypothetical protein